MNDESVPAGTGWTVVDRTLELLAVHCHGCLRGAGRLGMRLLW